jgi:hypothetical protein
MDVLNDVWQWLTENWIVVALVISEVAALLPAKAKGIIHFFLKVGKALFNKNYKQS